MVRVFAYFPIRRRFVRRKTVDGSDDTLDERAYGGRFLVSERQGVRNVSNIICLLGRALQDSSRREERKEIRAPVAIEALIRRRER